MARPCATALHDLRLRDSKAEWYRNRYGRSNTLESEGGPKAVPGKRRNAHDTVNTNVIQFAGKVLALVEAGSFPVELSDELESITYSDFAGKLKGHSRRIGTRIPRRASFTRSPTMQ